MGGLNPSCTLSKGLNVHPQEMEPFSNNLTDRLLILRSIKQHLKGARVPTILSPLSLQVRLKVIISWV